MPCPSRLEAGTTPTTTARAALISAVQEERASLSSAPGFRYKRHTKTRTHGHTGTHHTDTRHTHTHTRAGARTIPCSIKSQMNVHNSLKAQIHVLSSLAWIGEDSTHGCGRSANSPQAPRPLWLTGSPSSSRRALGRSKGRCAPQTIHSRYLQWWAFLVQRCPYGCALRWNAPRLPPQWARWDSGPSIRVSSWGAAWMASLPGSPPSGPHSPHL
mmetsp:Transcript_114894/g.228682  ORF Transcript_114894/g.228682 Transcript_114894/m.228682 type:complete len:214 (+) Transcript_114894:62-703(+)